MRSAPWMYVLGIVLIGLGIAAIALVIIIVVLRDSSYNDCKFDEVTYSISITKRVEDILITWYELSSNEECNSSTYKLQYWIDEGDVEEVSISEMYHTLPLLETCSTLFVLLWTISNEGNQSSNFTTKSYFEVPVNSGVSDVEFTNSDTGLNVTWVKLASLDKCQISYQSIMNADFGVLQYMNTVTEYVHIPFNLYCLEVNVTINTVVNDLSLGSSATSATYRDQEEIKDIEIESSTEVNTKVIVSWTKHSKHYLCTLEYVVEYVNEDGEEQTIQTENLTATFEANYCSSSLLSITANNTIGSTSSPTTTLESNLEPTQINQVTNVYFSNEDDKKVISWNVLSSFRKCDLTYKLDVTTDIGEFSFTTTYTTFEVPEDIYCSSLKFQIQAIYGELSSEPVVSGVYTFEDPISMKSIQRPTVSISEMNEADISWHSPACTDKDANLQYIITARNKFTNEEKSCSGQTNCTINLKDVCPYTDFTIEESSGIVKELTVSYNCD